MTTQEKGNVTVDIIDKIQKLPLERQQQILDFVNFIAQQHQEKLATIEDKPVTQERIVGLQKGKIWISDDFNEPLGDNFWGLDE